MRVPIAVIGILMLLLGAHEILFYLFGDDLGIQSKGEVDSPVPALLALLGLGLLLLSIWFRRKRIFLDSDCTVIIVRSSTPIWGCVRRISLSEATGVYRQCRRGTPGSTSVGIAYKDEGQYLLASGYEREDQFARTLSEHIQLPILEIPE